MKSRYYLQRISNGGCRTELSFQIFNHFESEYNTGLLVYSRQQDGSKKSYLILTKTKKQESKQSNQNNQIKINKIKEIKTMQFSTKTILALSIMYASTVVVHGRLSTPKGPQVDGSTRQLAACLAEGEFCTVITEPEKCCVGECQWNDDTQAYRCPYTDGRTRQLTVGSSSQKTPNPEGSSSQETTNPNGCISFYIGPGTGCDWMCQHCAKILDTGNYYFTDQVCTYESGGCVGNPIANTQYTCCAGA